MTITPRRVKATFGNFEKTRLAIVESGLISDLVGAAFDVDSSTVYLQAFQQKPWTAWARYKWLQNIEPWESRENIKQFAEKAGFLFVEGDLFQEQQAEILKPKKIKGSDAVDQLESLKEKIAFGTSLEDLESDLFIMHNFKLLSVLEEHRDELASFQQSIRRIKQRLKAEVSSKEPLEGDVILKKRKLNDLKVLPERKKRFGNWFSKKEGHK